MSGSLERLDRDVAALEEAISTMASEFGRAYTHYLSALGQATRKQLVLACFHLCTRGYPESFLKLTFAQREKLQSEIRQLAISGQQQLAEILSLEGLAVGERSPNPQKDAQDEGEDNPRGLERSSENPEEQLNSSEKFPSATPEVTQPDSQGIAPEQLVHWQKQVEVAILQILQTLSNQANHLLQTSGILPNQLPAPVPEDVKAEAVDSVGGPPNLLNLATIETENTQMRGEKPQITAIVAIYLRLTEIEFAEANVSAWRTQIRQLSHRLNALGQQYYQKRQEQVVAQAESTWRSSWFED